MYIFLPLVPKTRFELMDECTDNLITPLIVKKNILYH